MANASEAEWGPTDPRNGARARAEALLALGRYEDALPLLAELAVAEPGSAYPRCLLAQAYLGLDRPKDALSQAETAAGLEPTEEWCHRLRSVALLDLGRRREALSAAQEAVRLQPDRPECHSVLGEAQLARRDRAGAEASARRVLQLRPDHVGGHDLLGRAALSRGRFRSAEEHFRAALELDPANSALLNNVGVALRSQGRRREAVHLFGQASAADPHDSTARRNATAAARVGAVGVVVVLARVPFSAWRLLWPPNPATLVLVAVIVGLTTAGVRWFRRLRREHLYPEASPELLRSLRRQSTWRDWLPQRSRSHADTPIPMSILVMGSGLGLVLGAMCLFFVVHRSPVDHTPAYQYLLLIAAAFGLGGCCLVGILRRRGG